MSGEDIQAIDAMHLYGGNFAKRLADLALVADPENLDKIKATWPDLWAKYQSWQEPHV